MEPALSAGTVNTEPASRSERSDEHSATIELVIAGHTIVFHRTPPNSARTFIAAACSTAHDRV
jgi:hypothetical protein